MKLSWIVINGPDNQVQNASERLEVIADTFLSVNTPSQNALNEWLGLQPSIQKEIKGRVLRNYRFLQKCVTNDSGCRLLETEGGWYAVLSLPGNLPEEKWSMLFLEKDHVFVHPGYFFDFDQDGFIVVSLLCPEDTFQTGIRRIINRVHRENPNPV